MSLLYLNKIPASDQQAFDKKVVDIANGLGVNPNWLMQVMYSESRLNPRAVNPYSGAVGLIQFMPATALSLGTTATALKNMNAIQQLDFVRKYFLPYRGKMKSYYDVYAATFFPALIGKPDDWILQTKSLKAATIAKQNPAVNMNKDNQITVSEFKQYVRSTVSKNNAALIFGGAINIFAIILFMSIAYFLIIK
jgi:hypothetical protein